MLLHHERALSQIVEGNTMLLALTGKHRDIRLIYIAGSHHTFDMIKLLQFGNGGIEMAGNHTEIDIQFFAGLHAFPEFATCHQKVLPEM